MVRIVDYKDKIDLPSRLKATLKVMKSARSKNELMNIWESDILAVEDALTALSQWQPIKTAPRDATPILAANSRLPDLPPVVVRWLDEMSNPDTGWCDAATASGDALYFNANYFDLWMPAPAIPQAQSGGAET